MNPKKIEFNEDDYKILNNYKDNIKIIREKIDNQDINFYINFIVNSLFEANKYFNDQEPWNKKEDLLRLNTIVFTTLEIVRKISFLLYPIIPESSIKALKIFDISEADINLSSIENNNFLSKVDKILKDNNVFHDNIGMTQSDFFEIEDELKINIKDLFKINNEWYNNY